MAITNRATLLQEFCKGNGVWVPFSGATSSAGTAGNAGSGYFSCQMSPNEFATWPGIGDTSMPSGLTSIHQMSSISSWSNTSRGTGLFRIYKVGTLNLTTSTGEFTHDAATFPVTRTVMGQASQPHPLVPMIIVTTALTTTAAVFTMNYTSDSGASVTGTKTFTFPSATTNNGSVFFPKLEAGDLGARDITDIVITTTSATGACDVYLAEFLTPSAGITVVPSYFDSPSSGFSGDNLAPAAPTAGTLTSQLVLLSFATSAMSGTFVVTGVKP